MSKLCNTKPKFLLYFNDGLDKKPKYLGKTDTIS
jgi:hypothetical protein